MVGTSNQSVPEDLPLRKGDIIGPYGNLIRSTGTEYWKILPSGKHTKSY